MISNGLLKGFPARHGGTPLSLDGLFQGKSQSKMDKDWGTPTLGNPNMDKYY